MMKAIIFIIGWACFWAVVTFIICLLLTGFITPITSSLFYLGLFPVRLLIYFAKWHDIKWYSRLALYGMTLPFLLLLLVGYTRIACSYELFLPGTNTLWAEAVCEDSDILGMAQFSSTAYTLGFFVILLGIFGGTNPDAPAHVQRMEARSYVFDRIAIMLGEAFLVALVTVIGLFLVGKNSYWVVPPIGSVLVVFLNRDDTPSTQRILLRTTIIIVCVIVVLSPALLEGICWWFTYFGWMPSIITIGNCHTLRGLY